MWSALSSTRKPELAVGPASGRLSIVRFTWNIAMCGAGCRVGWSRIMRATEDALARAFRPTSIGGCDRARVRTASVGSAGPGKQKRPSVVAHSRGRSRAWAGRRVFHVKHRRQCVCGAPGAARR
ncbi:hypothetical protein ABA31_17400 [Agrococcus baldri]|uniref:Uncharacterized protein n=1 Tax=Agrococcus baldri TaxID=153730 RepID=A0AA87RC99_9MICO|nr:hypothetical protein ABA31_17400 [Agrococcus baldri]